MKNLFTSMLVLLLVGILAGGALAQDKTQKQNFDGDSGISDDPHGDANRHDFKDDDEISGPHGPMTDNADQGGEKLFLDEDGDGFSDCDLIAEDKSTDNVGKGNNNRNENQHKADTGPHGPANLTDENMNKDFGEDGLDSPGTRDGVRDFQRETHGPGREEISGPHDNEEGFGEENDQGASEGVYERVRRSGRK